MKLLKHGLPIRFSNIRAELGSIQLKLSEMQHYQALYDETKAELNRWLERYPPKTLFTEDLVSQISEINDRVLRFKLFKLTTHYWEARWLLELESFLANRESDKKSPRKLLRKLRRFAKLTPCFVSTLYMLPSTFMAGVYQDNTWMDLPLYEQIDLLIMDEAG